MRTIAFYLPQFHCIPENDEWWGEGFTEWVNVKKAESLFEGHYQPREPLNDFYYNLLDDTTMAWQVKLAKEYGIYGFCMYHYWFDGKLLLEKPVEMYLKNKSLDLPFCLCWANENWTNGWAAKDAKILIGQTEGNRDKWKEHFEYFLPFFKDDRYIKVDDKPLLVIYKPDMFPKMKDMMDYWNELALNEGLKGITYASQLIPNQLEDSPFDYHIEYQPTVEYIDMTKTRNSMVKMIKNSIKKVAKTVFKKDLEGMKIAKLARYSYDEMWQRILDKKVKNEKMIPGAFVDWDNTARKKNRGYVIEGATPKKFKKYFKKQVVNARENYKKDMIFIFAWNEWAESGYLEPDKKYGYKYLEAVREALEETGEMI